MSENFLKISKSEPLVGAVRVNGAKNAILPMVMASVLTSQKVTYKNVPAIKDVTLVKQLIEDIGGEVNFSDDILSVQTKNVISSKPSSSIVKSFRGSVWMLGPLLARTGSARLALPGGDIIGKRPVDIHLRGLEAMGATIELKNSMIFADAPQGLNAAEFDLGFPSVGATHQLLMAAALTEGESLLKNTACEPEVEALCGLLNQMGAKVSIEKKSDYSQIRILGKKELSGTEVKLIGDRIEAATFILAAAMTGGELIVQGFDPRHLGEFLDVLTEMGVDFIFRPGGILIRSSKKLKAVNVETAPFPGLATDIQPQLTAALCIADGVSYIKENLYESRFTHVYELNKMGANISIKNEGQLGSIACIQGVSQLQGAKVSGLDIRAAAAMLIAALVAEGETQIFEPQHLDRGYYDYHRKYQSLGALLEISQPSTQSDMFIGC